MQSFNLDQSGSALLTAVDRIAADTIQKHARDNDVEARFPRENIEALRAAGLLGLISAREVGGHGQGLRAAAAVCERIARECPSTAMVMKMHYCGSAVIEAHGDPDLRRAIAAGKHLTTLAFSEFGSRSHFWVPVSTATPAPNDTILLNANKQLITSAGECDLYIWSSKPAAAEGLSSLWWVPSRAPGLTLGDRYQGLGLRANASAPIGAVDVEIPAANRLGADGKGFDLMMGVVLPWFSVQNHAVSTGMMEGVLRRTVAHVTGQGYDYSGAKIAEFPQVRGNVARMRTKIDMSRALLIDAIDAIERGRDDAQLRVLQSKVTGAETSLEVHDLAMRVCGGAAYRKDIAVERFFRDSRAASVMAPVSDALWDFIGKAECGMPLFA
ncbi:MAG: acyl-CoA/acyl-ACP dehydrogenase [Gammaproteobacteria bacterium]|nr:acyl-CoA/acyl-ACP dehydrogenase [Gammaproteobacteria bacterium]